MNLIVAVGAGGDFAAHFERDGHRVLGLVDPGAIARAVDAPASASPVLEMLDRAEALVLEVSRGTLTADVVDACDRAGVRIVPLCRGVDEERLAAAFGLGAPLRADAEAWAISDALVGGGAAARAEESDALPDGPRTIAVWGTHGAPGRSTVAVELAVELARGGRRVALVDADTHAPSLAIALGLADEGPGFAAACRQAELGGLDARELTRIALPLSRGGGVEVLTGLNRASRWPELTAPRVTRALEVCREWVDFTVVDVAASLEQDEEIISDFDGLRRNAATIAAVRGADLVVAVVRADPIGVARFLRGHAQLRATVGATPIVVVANGLRPGALGVDARGQVRRTLERFAGIRDVWFLPQDPRSIDRALLAARPVADVAPKSPFVLALRRFVGDAITAPAALPRRLGRTA